MSRYDCPECKGEGTVWHYFDNAPVNEKIREDAPPEAGTGLYECYFCNGTGYASEDDTEERFYRG